MKSFFKLLAVLALAVSPLAAQTQAPIRVNCGGHGLTDSQGQWWTADTGYNEGKTTTSAETIVGTPDSALYQTNRYNTNHSKGMTYTFKVPDGKYHVNLYFAETAGETYYHPGARVFNVLMQGATVFSNLDIFAEAGAKAALIKGADVSVTNGEIVIEFEDVVQNAQINAIEILPGTSGPELSLSFHYPDGTPVVGTLHYKVASTLLSFQGEVPLNNGQATCAIFANPSSLGLSLQFTVTASLNDAAGNLLWEMNMGLNPSQVNLAAVQSSNLAVTVQKQASSVGRSSGR